jgi:hypothetical protein
MKSNGSRRPAAIWQYARDDLESQEGLFEFGQTGEVVWLQDLSLNDAEVDLGLIEPAGVNRGVSSADQWSSDPDGPSRYP